MSNIRDDIKALVDRIVANDSTAADDLDLLAERLKLIASQIRQRGASPFIQKGGFGDSVTMQLVGPDGQVKQTVHAK
jgi:hypothetical protein